MKKNLQYILIFSIFFIFFIAATSYAVEITYTYDSLNSLTSVVYSKETSTTTLTYEYDAAGNMTNASGVTHTLTTCQQCLNDPVILENEEFSSETDCQCVSSTYITIGSGVIVRNGGKVIFKAPKVNVKSGATFENGSVVKITQ